MTLTTTLVTLILLFPLAGFLFIGLGFKKIPAAVTSVIAPGTIFASFLLSVYITFFDKSNVGQQVHHLFTWISLDKITINFDLLVDPLSCLMLLIVTGVGFLIHIYATGYMKDDEGINRFFAFMNLFVFSMLLLILASNYVVMFIGWEGVGLCSYLLIGFWYRNPDFNDAAKKAFIMNRIGDLGFLIGLFLLFTTFGSFDFLTIFHLAKNFPSGTMVIVMITMLLFVGAVGKSAQIPLYTWLPDAMAGPTPVSALIHAATMVTAGIYMIARSNILYTLAPPTMMVIIIIGILTALFSAVIAVFQNDIKKILAYSTISQLGYMFVALGLGAFTGAMFHLTTHAFFKALLFLAAGSVIHALGGEQDIRNMGGLRKKLPKTWLVFLAGTISISGIPPFAGFFSKEEILNAAFGRDYILWGLTIIGVVLTTLYMFRMLFRVFLGSSGSAGEKHGHIHEPSATMLVPMMILAFFAFAGGLIDFPELAGTSSWLKHYLGPVFSDSLSLLQKSSPLHSGSYELILAGFTTLAVLIVILVSYSLYGKAEKIPGNVQVKQSWIKRILINKFYIDEFYDFLVVRSLMQLSKFLYRWIEQNIIDKAVNGLGVLVQRIGNTIRFLQTGHVGFYLFIMVFGIIAILIFNTVLN